MAVKRQKPSKISTEVLLSVMEVIEDLLQPAAVSARNLHTRIKYELSVFSTMHRYSERLFAAAIAAGRESDPAVLDLIDRLAEWTAVWEDAFVDAVFVGATTCTSDVFYPFTQDPQGVSGCMMVDSDPLLQLLPAAPIELQPWSMVEKGSSNG